MVSLPSAPMSPAPATNGSLINSDRPGSEPASSKVRHKCRRIVLQVRIGTTYITVYDTRKSAKVKKLYIVGKYRITMPANYTHPERGITGRRYTYDTYNFA